MKDESKGWMKALVFICADERRRDKGRITGYF
jgi:hypothetical protein